MSAPANSVFQTVVASEQFAIHYESRRTEDTKLMRMAVSESQSCSCSRTGSSNPSPSSRESGRTFQATRGVGILKTAGKVGVRSRPIAAVHFCSRQCRPMPRSGLTYQGTSRRESSSSFAEEASRRRAAAVRRGSLRYFWKATSDGNPTMCSSRVPSSSRRRR